MSKPPLAPVREATNDGLRGRLFQGGSRAVEARATRFTRYAVNSTEAPSEYRWGARTIMGELAVDGPLSFGTFRDNVGNRAPETVVGFGVSVGEDCKMWMASEDGSRLHFEFGVSAELFAWTWNELLSRPTSQLTFRFSVSGYVTGGDPTLYIPFTEALEQVALSEVHITVADELSPVASPGTYRFQPW